MPRTRPRSFLSGYWIGRAGAWAMSSWLSPERDVPQFVGELTWASDRTATVVQRPARNRGELAADP
jgi:hypothetical protein